MSVSGSARRTWVTHSGHAGTFVVKKMLVPTLRPTANSSGFPLLVALGFLLVALAAVLRSPNDLGWSTRTVVQLPKISRVRCFAETSPRNAPSVPSLPFEGEVKRRSALVAGLTAPITPLSLSFAEGFFPQTAQASLLTAQQPVSDPRELLRDALPINNKPIRKIQKEIFAKVHCQPNYLNTVCGINCLLYTSDAADEEDS
eukprot:112975-Amorphochlora_amoeboformis.AAC.3